VIPLRTYQCANGTAIQGNDIPDDQLEQTRLLRLHGVKSVVHEFITDQNHPSPVQYLSRLARLRLLADPCADV
jgi:hypothetical protein